MRCCVTRDVEEFARSAVPYLEQHPVEHNVPLGAVVAQRTRKTNRQDGAPLFAWVEDAGQVCGAATWMPPYSLYVSLMPADAVSTLVDELAALRVALTGVAGAVEHAEEFAAQWSAACGVRTHVHPRERIYRLDEVAEPPAVSGEMRPGTAADVDLLARWVRARGDEADLVGGDDRQWVRHRVREGRLFVWSDPGPTSMAGTAEPISGIVRLAPVYTPPEHRGQGYARALVAAVSSHALQQGASACMLYSDLDHASSTAIYQQVGYRPLRDIADIRFRVR